MELVRIEPGISLIGLTPPIAGFEGFLGTYVIQSDKTALIDVGPTSTLDDLFNGLAELNVKPEEVDYILCTHIHIDHSGGAGGALKQMPKATCLVHEKGKYHVGNPAKLWQSSLKTLEHLAQAYGEPEAVAENKLITASEGMIIDLGGIKLEVFLTPGHASHHLSFMDRQNSRLFVGEAGGVYFPKYGGGRPATPIPFDLKQALSTLDKLIAAEPARVFYAHFGAATNGKDLLKQNKNQLLLWAEVVANHASDQAEWQEILEELITRDKTMTYLNKLPEDRLQLERYFIKNAIGGLKGWLGKS